MQKLRFSARAATCSKNGMPRFFRRLAEGVFDEEDLIRRTY
jgi:predicted esterase